MRNAARIHRLGRNLSAYDGLWERMSRALDELRSQIEKAEADGDEPLVLSIPAWYVPPRTGRRSRKMKSGQKRTKAANTAEPCPPPPPGHSPA